MEIDARLKNKDWRMSNLYKIVDKEGRLIKFKPNQAQAKYIAGRAQRNILLKARQLGFTTWACVDILDCAIFTKNYNAAIIAHDQESMKKIFKKVKLAWDYFPKSLRNWLGISADTNTANEIAFNNGSTIRVTLSSRSDTLQRLHISEFGKICAKYPLKAEEIITGSIPSAEMGRIDIESTAEGETGAYHALFWEAWERGEPTTYKEFKAHFFGWTEDEDYRMPLTFALTPRHVEFQNKHSLTDEQIAWYVMEEKVQKNKMPQEYPITPEEAFLGSGAKMISPEAIEWQKQFLKDSLDSGSWNFYFDYKASHRYGLGADVAEGIGQDHSTAVIIDFTLGHVVATYRSNSVGADVFAHEILRGARRYGECLVAIERNNHGHSTLNTIKHLYKNLYKERDTSGVLDKTKTKLGWHTNKRTKPHMMYELKEALEDHLLTLHDKILYTEARTYDKQDLAVTVFDEDQTNHWDLFTAAAIAWQMRNHARKTAGNVIQVDTGDLFEVTSGAPVSMSVSALEDKYGL